MKKQCYSIKLIDKFEFSEIDFDLYENLFGHDWDDDTKDHPQEIGSYERIDRNIWTEIEGYPDRKSVV